MASTTEMIQALQAALKRKKIRYTDIAQQLALSESSIKRLFSKGDMPLSRLQEICDIVGLDIAELAILAIENRRTIKQLSYQQEQILTDDVKLLLLTYLLMVGWEYTEIITIYDFTEPEAIGMLAKLDKMKLIELLPNNRVRIRLARDFQWRKKGPFNRFFNQQVQTAFFQTDFSKAGSLRLANNGYVSHATLDLCHRKMATLHRELDELIKSDAHLDKKHVLPITHITAIRPWVFPVFNQFAREPDRKMPTVSH